MAAARADRLALWRYQTLGHGRSISKRSRHAKLANNQAKEEQKDDSQT
jgi:hypothetical protein